MEAWGEPIHALVGMLTRRNNYKNEVNQTGVLLAEWPEATE